MKTGRTVTSLLLLLLLATGGCNNEPVTSATSPDGVDLHFINRGKGEPAIVLVHGWTNSYKIWENQLPFLTEKYQVIALDLAGHGESGNNRTQWTMKAFGQDIAAVVKAASLDEVILVGFSMGGPAIVEAAPLLEDRLTGLIFVETIRDPEMKTPPPMAHMMDSLLMDLIQHPTAEKLVQMDFFRSNIEKNMAKVNAMLGHDETGWEECLLETIRWENEDQMDALKALSVPVMAINRENPPTNEEALRHIFPSFEVTYIPNSGHVLMWDAPDEFNEALENAIRQIVQMEK